MPKRSSTRKPKEDFSQAAFRIVQALTSENPSEEPLTSALDSAELRKEIMRAMGKRGGKKGGKARAASLTSEQRTEIAKKAASSRWSKNS